MARNKFPLNFTLGILTPGRMVWQQVFFGFSDALMDRRLTHTGLKRVIVLLLTGRNRLRFKLFFLSFFLALQPLAANLPGSERAYQSYLKARQDFLQTEANLTNAIELARAIFEYAEFKTEDSERAELAEEGISVARKAIQLNPHSSEAHYYLAMNLGQLARTKTIGALKIVKDMEREFKQAIEIDPRIDYGGPQRSLGELYLETPGAPASIGNKTKARMHLENAVKLAPEFPDNHLLLMQAYIKAGDKKALDKEMDLYRKDILIKARKTFPIDKWQSAWNDWQKRWAAIQEESLKLE
jgi:tetratricopeptide (TPR) repeat protein